MLKIVPSFRCYVTANNLINIMLMRVYFTSWHAKSRA